MKKLFSIVLCIFILLQGGILSIQYVFKLIQHKIIIENGLEKGLFNAQLIPFNSSELLKAKWENGHEFFLAGEKYDVVKTSRLNGETQYTCINDKVEKALINNLEKSEKKSNLIEDLLKKINIHFKIIIPVEILNPLPEIVSGFSYSQDAYSFIFSRVVNKPPIS